MDGVVDYQYVQINDIIGNQQDGKIIFSADSITNKNVRATKVEYDNSDQYSWHGSTYDGLFSMIINKNPNGFSGTIIDDEKLFRLFAIDSTKSIMLEFGDTNNQFLCSNEGSPSSASPAPTAFEDCDEICPGNIDILFLLPQETQDWLVSEENYLSYIQLMISDLELAWGNSEVVHTVDFTWADFDWIDPPNPDNKCQISAQNLADNQQAQILRNEHNADLVILLAPPLTTWPDALACVAEIGPIASEAYGIVPIDVSFQYFSFVHEIGHLFGAQRSFSSISFGDCSFGHKLYFETGPFTGYSIPTVMRKEHNLKIPYFSNPFVYYQGQATGVYDDYLTGRSANNAGRINETGCIISDFTPSNSINPFIQVSEENCLLNLTAIVEPTNPLYSFSWKWSLDGLFTDSYPGQQLGIGYGSTISTEQPIQQPCEIYFIQLTVSLFASPGVPGTVVATEVISKRGDICTDNVQDCDEIIGLIQQEDSNKIHQSKIKNQTHDSKLFDIKEDYLFDIYGRLILNSTSNLEVESKLRMLPIGIYFLSKKSKNGKINSEKIFNNNFK
jgi:hypothetical protein